MSGVHRARRSRRAWSAPPPARRCRAPRATGRTRRWRSRRGTDRKDHRMLERWPRRQHPIICVQVSCAHLVQRSTGEAIASGLAPRADELRDCATRGVSAAPSQLPNLLLGGLGQADVDRRRPLTGSSSSSARWSSRRTRPARISAAPLCASKPDRATRSRRLRSTSASRCGPWLWRRSSSTICFTAAREVTLTRTGREPATTVSTPASIQARTVGAEISRSEAASAIFAPRSRSAKCLRTKSSVFRSSAIKASSKRGVSGSPQRYPG